MNNFYSEPLYSDATVLLSIVRPLWLPLFSTLPKSSTSPIVPPDLPSHLSAFLRPSAFTDDLQGIWPGRRMRILSCYRKKYVTVWRLLSHYLLLSRLPTPALELTQVRQLYLFISSSRLMAPLLETTALAANHLMMTPRVLASHSMYLPCATASILGER